MYPEYGVYLGRWLSRLLDPDQGGSRTLIAHSPIAPGRSLLYPRRQSPWATGAAPCHRHDTNTTQPRDKWVWITLHNTHMTLTWRTHITLTSHYTYIHYTYITLHLYYITLTYVTLTLHSTYITLHLHLITLTLHYIYIAGGAGRLHAAMRVQAAARAQRGAAGARSAVQVV